MATYNEMLKNANMTDEELKVAVIAKLEDDGVHLSEFNDGQKNKIIKTYAASILSAAA